MYKLSIRHYDFCSTAEFKRVSLAETVRFSGLVDVVLLVQGVAVAFRPVQQRRRVFGLGVSRGPRLGVRLDEWSRSCVFFGSVLTVVLFARRLVPPGVGLRTNKYNIVVVISDFDARRFCENLVV